MAANSKQNLNERIMAFYRRKTEERAESARRSKQAKDYRRRLADKQPVEALASLNQGGAS